MNKNAIKEKFIRKIYKELQDYKNSVLAQDDSIIYRESYQIETVSTLYEVLLQKADFISDTILLKLVEQSSGILEIMYQDWLKEEDSSYQELVEYVDRKLEHRF